MREYQRRVKKVSEAEWKQLQASKERNVLEMSRRTEIIKNMEKWNEFRATREVVRRDYSVAKKKEF
jgi:hypothetical protein